MGGQVLKNSPDPWGDSTVSQEGTCLAQDSTEFNPGMTHSAAGPPRSDPGVTPKPVVA